MVLLQVSLTFGQPLSQADLWSAVPPVEVSVIKGGTASSQLNIWSAFESG